MWLIQFFLSFQYILECLFYNIHFKKYIKCKGLIPIIETESGLSHVRNLEKVKTGRKYITMGVFSVGISKLIFFFRFHKLETFSGR